MAIVFMDSFDHSSSAFPKWDYANNTNMQAGRFGNAVRLRGVGGSTIGLSKSNLSIGSSGTLGFGFYDEPTGMNTGNRQAIIREGSTEHLYLANETIYPIRLSVYRGDGTKLGTGTITFPKSAWVHIELTYTIGDAPNGSFELRINGVLSCSGSGIDTRNGGSSGVSDGVAFVSPNWDGSWGSLLDDVYVASGATPLGDLRVQYLAPTGPGVRTQFTPSTGANWSTVDDATPADGDYNQSNVVSAMDLFSMPDIGNYVVQGVQTVLRHKKDDAGFRTIQPVLYRADVDDGGTPPSSTPRWYRGTQVSAYDTFVGSTQMLATSPLSGLSWTRDEINALQFGYAVGEASMFTLDAKVV